MPGPPLVRHIITCTNDFDIKIIQQFHHAPVGTTFQKQTESIVNSTSHIDNASKTSNSIANMQPQHQKNIEMNQTKNPLQNITTDDTEQKRTERYALTM